jgi:hypothetical protein
MQTLRVATNSPGVMLHVKMIYDEKDSYIYVLHASAAGLVSGAGAA